MGWDGRVSRQTSRDVLSSCPTRVCVRTCVFIPLHAPTFSIPVFVVNPNPKMVPLPVPTPAPRCSVSWCSSPPIVVISHVARSVCGVCYSCSQRLRIANIVRDRVSQHTRVGHARTCHMYVVACCVVLCRCCITHPLDPHSHISSYSHSSAKSCHSASPRT